MARNFTKKTVLKSTRDMLVSDKAKAGVERYVTESPRSVRVEAAADTPGTSARRREATPEAQEEASNFTATAAKSGTISPQPRRQAVHAAEKAAKRAAAAASSAKTADPDKDKEAEKGGVKFGKGAHA
jgi:hypothetical protein